MSAEVFGRQPLTVVELDVRQTIAVVQHNLTYRLSSHDVVPPISLDARPVIETITTLPTKLDIGESLGLRAAITVRCRDFLNDNDVAGGPANPQATFFRLLKARVPYVTNRPARVITGYLADDGSFTPERTLHFLLVRIDGPDKQGLVTIHLTDALVKTDNRKAQAPSVGTGTLLAALNETDSSATITPVESADDYPSSGFLRIGESKEIIRFTRSGAGLTLTRGQRGTTTTPHEVGATLQEILIIEQQTLSAVCRRLLVDYANLDATLIDFSAWSGEDTVWLGAFRVSTVIWDPTGVATLLQELTQQFPFYILYDARVPRLDFQAIKPATFSLSAQLNERDHLLANSVSISDDLEKRVSQIWFYFGVKDFSEKIDDPRNFSKLVPFIDRQAEIDHGEKRIRKVFSRWLPTNQDAVVTSIGSLMLLRLRDGRRLLRFDLDAKDGHVWVGDTVEITTDYLVDGAGDPVTTQAQVIEAKETREGTINSYQAEDLRLDGRFALYAPDTIPNYPSATASDRGQFGFYADDNDLIDSDPAYLYL